MTAPAVLAGVFIMAACAFALYGQAEVAWWLVVCSAGMLCYILGYKHALYDLSDETTRGVEQ